MKYYKVIQDGKIVAAGCNFLKWAPRTGRFVYCEMEQAQAVKDVVTEQCFHADWLLKIPEEAGVTFPEAIVILIGQEEYDEVVEELMDGEPIPVPPEPEPEPQPEPEPDVFDRATKFIAKGEYFYLNRKLCKAKTTIACGAILTLNTNYEITTVENELTKLSKGE